MHMSSVGLYQGQVLLLYKTGYVSQETRPKFIDSQHFYFHFHLYIFFVSKQFIYLINYN